MTTNHKTYYYAKPKRIQRFRLHNKRAYGQDDFSFRVAQRDCQIIDLVSQGINSRQAIADSLGITLSLCTHLVHQLLEDEVLCEEKRLLKIAPLNLSQGAK